MTCSPATRRLAVVGRSAAGQPHPFRLEARLELEVAPRPAASRDAAYRRLAAVLLGLDVPTLAHELRLARARQTAPQSVAAA
jgi:hypothetical protein